MQYLFCPKSDLATNLRPDRVYSYYLRDCTALTAAAAELAEVAIAPRVDEALVGQRQRLGVAAAARHLHHPLAGERLHLLGLESASIELIWILFISIFVAQTYWARN